ncbi:MAG: HEAT repeat domain-containing protein [bacterium]
MGNNQPQAMTVGAFYGALAVLVLCSAAGSAFAAPNAAPRLKVCMVSLNEPHETDVFRKSLDAKRFEFIDIRAVADAARPPSLGDSGAPWLANACTPQTNCDVMVYTAEFAGRFFGKLGSIGLQEMEEASCQARCAGMFQKPAEVFLLACNTLATKSEDSRSPEEYLQVLLEHGFDRGAAERVVELRYGPLGPSFRESLRRVFAGVPRIYGFSSVAPRGEITAPMLARYLRGQGDYAQTLQRKGRDAGRNTALMVSFKGTALTQTNGLTPLEAAAVDRKDICALYDESRPVLERLRIAYGFLMRRDALNFVPTLQVFLARHPYDSLSWLERSALAEIRGLDAPREQVLGLVERLNVSALKLELAHFAALVGWLHPQELHDLAVASATQLLHEPLSSEVVDIMCEITKHEPLHADFKVGDIPPAVYANAQGLRLVSCLAPTDRRVATRVAAALDSPDTPRRQWAAHALTRLQPRDPELLERLVPYLRDPSPEVASRIAWLLQSNGRMPRNVTRAIRVQDEQPREAPPPAELLTLR